MMKTELSRRKLQLYQDKEPDHTKTKHNKQKNYKIQNENKTKKTNKNK